MFIELLNRFLWIKGETIDQVFLTGKKINEFGYVEAEETIVERGEGNKEYEEYTVKVRSNGLTYIIDTFSEFDPAHNLLLEILAQLEK